MLAHLMLLAEDVERLGAYDLGHLQQVRGECLFGACKWEKMRTGTTGACWVQTWSAQELRT